MRFNLLASRYPTANSLHPQPLWVGLVSYCDSAHIVKHEMPGHSMGVGIGETLGFSNRDITLGTLGREIRRRHPSDRLEPVTEGNHASSGPPAVPFAR